MVTAAREVHNEPGTVFRVDEVHLADSDVGLINRDKNPPYRVFVDHADLDVTNLSNQSSQGPGKARLRGRFMGSGAAHAEATFRSYTTAPDFDLSLAVADTQLAAMNELLRAYGNFATDAGSLALYVQMRVGHGRIEGYVKPLFKDIKVHNDQQGGLGHKIYNKLLQGAAKLLKNRQTDQVATEVSLAGPLGSARVSTWQLIANMVQNAFFKAILPGFEKQSHAKG